MSGGRTVRQLLTASRMRKHDSSKIVLEEGAAIWQQGDLTLYTEENVRQRAAVRQHAEVLELLHRWWSTALRSMHLEKSFADMVAQPSKVGDDGIVEHELSKSHYVSMMKKMYRVMIEEYDEEDAEECAKEDWEKDVRGGTALGREAFCDALFELADVWTKTCDAAEYVEFLAMLHERVALRDAAGTSWLWKDDEDIAFDAQFDAEALPETPAAVRMTPGARSLSPGLRSSSRHPRSTKGAGMGGSSHPNRFAASGLHWQRLDGTPDAAWLAERTELSHEALAAALLAKTADGSSRAIFSADEWSALGCSYVSWTQYVHARPAGFFVPLESDGKGGARNAASALGSGRTPLKRSTSARRVGLLSVKFVARLRAGVGRRRANRDAGGAGGASGAQSRATDLSNGAGGGGACTRPPTVDLAASSYKRGRLGSSSSSKQPRSDLVPTPEMMITRGGSRTGSSRAAFARSIGGAAVLNFSFGGPSALKASRAAPGPGPGPGAMTVAGGSSTTASTGSRSSSTPAGGAADFKPEWRTSPPPMVAGMAEVWTLPGGTASVPPAQPQSQPLPPARPRPPTLSLSQRATTRLKALSPRGFSRGRPATAAPPFSASSSFAAVAAAADERRPRTALPPVTLPAPSRTLAKKHWTSS